MATTQADDWQSERSLVQCNKYLLVNKIGCDVKFKVGSQQTEIMSAHKLLLANRSSVFSAMFYGSLPESNTIAIPDIEPDIFKEFLSYIYVDEVNLTGNNVCSLMYTANKYSMGCLKNKCSSFLQANICTSNVCIIIENAHTFNQVDLFEKCKKLILENSTQILSSSGLINVCSTCLRSIISSDELNENESDIFNAVVEWAEYQCKKKNIPPTPTNKRQAIGDILYEIRFPLLDAGKFAEIAETDLLTPDEQLDVFKAIPKGKAKSTKFNSRQRISSESFYILQNHSEINIGDFDSDIEDECDFPLDSRTMTETNTFYASQNAILTGIVLQSINGAAYVLDITCSDIQQENALYTGTQQQRLQQQGLQQQGLQQQRLHPQRLRQQRQQQKRLQRQRLQQERLQQQIPQQQYQQTLLSVTVPGETDKGRFVHFDCLEPFHIQQGHTYMFIAKVNQNMPSRSFQNHCLDQKYKKTYNSIKDIPSDPCPPLQLEESPIMCNRPSQFIIGFSYKR